MSTKLVLMVVVLFGAAMAVEPAPDVPENVFDWYAGLPSAEPKYTPLHIFIHDIIHGDDPSVVEVVQANVTASSPTQFGLINVVDDPLTLGPETNSTSVGYVEGLYLSSSRVVSSVLAAVNFVFYSGRYNGSTLSVLGRIPRDEVNREFPVVGGSGYFRLAQGVVAARSLGMDPQGNPIVECRFLLKHY